MVKILLLGWRDFYKTHSPFPKVFLLSPKSMSIPMKDIADRLLESDCCIQVGPPSTVICKPPLVELEAVAFPPITHHLRKETDTLFSAESFQVDIDSDETSLFSRLNSHNSLSCSL